MALITFETTLLREKEQIRVAVEYGAYPDELFLNSVTPISIMDENEVEKPCDSKAELLTTPEEDRQMLSEAEIHWADHHASDAEQRRIWASQEEDYQAWRRS